MSQSQNVIYYTTAQVTELVELSDQNVRKYVRMLEDRDYEVAKDEHNRRLFSKKDVKVLQEMIKIAKSPGNTLESAADEIIENLDEFDEDVVNQANQVTKISDSEISKLLALVLEKLDEIQNENKELKTNINSLVHRLEEYDRQALEYTPYEEDVQLTEEETSDVVDEGNLEEETTEHQSEQLEKEESETTESSEHSEEETEEVAPVVEESVQDTEETTEEKETTDQTANDSNQSANIDMSQGTSEETNEKQIDSTDTPKEEPVETPNPEPKKGFFGKLASIFK